MSTLDDPSTHGSARIGGPGGDGPTDGPANGPTDAPTPGPASPHATFAETQATPEFQQLRRSLRRFAFPATVAFLAWYLLYVLMSGYARGFMDTKLLGNINVAYVFGLLQFISTFVIAYLYAKYAEKNLDPTADAIRARLEGGSR